MTNFYFYLYYGSNTESTFTLILPLTWVRWCDSWVTCV